MRRKGRGVVRGKRRENRRRKEEKEERKGSRTDLEIYDGTTAVKAAARRPAADRLVTSVVNK
jgi:hypothetical protein